MTACRMFASYTRMAMAACSLRGLAVPLLRRFDTVFLVRARLQSTQELPVQPKYAAITSLTQPPWKKVILPNPEEEILHHKEVIQQANTMISERDYGRLFAVVQFAARQWKVTAEDLILIEAPLQAECGDRICMEKVLLVGGGNFTLLGRPLLKKDLVRVEATIIEKTETWPKISFHYKARKREQRKHVIATPQTVLRINSIDIAPTLR
uniref:large ribosomal subunit protein bL21m-like isoform X2 n=1 Tax=Myxine glutinosa TaxID=7769 RepID=UPI00358E004D